MLNFRSSHPDRKGRKERVVDVQEGDFGAVWTVSGPDVKA